MSREGTELRNAAKIIAPYGGAISYLYTSGAAASQDLSAIGFQQPIADNGGFPGPDVVAPIEGTQVTLVGGVSPQQGLLGRYVRFTAYSANIWIVQGPTLASVTSVNAPVLPAGTSSLLNAAGNSEPIFAGTWVDLWVSQSTRFLGYLGSGAGWLIVRPSSVGGQG